MLKLRRTESVNVDMRIFAPDMVQQIEVPLKRKFRMVAALHQDLHAANCGEFVQFLIDLSKEKRSDRILFRPIECAELAVNIANVGVVDVAIDNVGDDLTSAAAITFRLRQIAPGICQDAEFLQWRAIQLQSFVR